MTRKTSIITTTVLALCAGLYLAGCGGDSAKLAADLNSGAPGGSPMITTGPADSGGGIFRAPGHRSAASVNLPDDPWAMPELDLQLRNASGAASPAVMDKLESILDRELRIQGKSRDRVVAKAPGGTGNAVFDLVAEAIGSPITGVRLRWTERVVGDYDANGEVNVADLTPIALNFGGTPDYDPPGDHGGIAYWPSGDPDGAGAANWREAGVDGDDNGEINLGDISPIAVHFGERLDGFAVYRRLEGETNFSLIPNPANPGLPYTTGRPSVPAGTPPRYAFEDSGTTSGSVEYYVAPYDTTTSQAGSQSNQAGIQLSSGPVADLTADTTSGNVPLTVNFDGSGSTDADGTIVKYEFDFGEGVGFEDFGTTATANYEYTALGTFTAVLRVTDNEDNTDTDSVIITTTGQAPVPVLSADVTYGDAPLFVNFDASGSSDPDGTIEKIEFDFDNGAGYQERPLTTSFTFSTPGSFEVLLRLTDDDGLVSTASVMITAIAPGSVGLPPLWEVAKANAGVSDSSMGFFEIAPWSFNQSFWTGYTDFKTMLPAYFDVWFQDVEGTPELLAAKADSVETTGDLQDLFLEANGELQVDHQIVEQAWDGTIANTDALANAIADFVDGVGGTSDFATYQAALGALGDPEQAALAAVVYGALNAWQGRDNSMRGVFGDIDLPAGRDILDDAFNNCHGYGLWALQIDTSNFGDFGWMYLPQGEPPDQINFFRHFPYTARNLAEDTSLFEGAAQLCDAIDELTAFMAGSPTFANVSLDIDTPAGKVTIGGTGNDTYEQALDGNGHAILIDLGGDDIYNSHAGGTASSYNGAAVCIDLGGNDTYNNIDDPDDFDRSVGYSNDDTCQQGSARMGIGVLVDYSGTDLYTGIRMAQGSGIWGVGILADYGPEKDIYNVEAFGQGAAMSGIGILLDEGGDDEYLCFSKAQGFGGPQGVGYLVDRGAGADIYYAEPVGDPGKPEYDATDVYGTNMSIAQGIGWGARWGWIDITSGENNYLVTIPGGQGLLFDGGGDDVYTAGTFGMGMGFFHGLGLLLDRDGNDEHYGHWYTQGATAHAAAAGVLDFAGDDLWDNEASIGIGGAHDWSVSWFLEMKGNDTYNASPLALGTGYSNGFGYFLDFAGDDTYNAAYADGATDNLGIGKLGDANRPTMPSYGIFVDQGGVDIYDPDYQNMLDSVGLPGDNAEWTRVIPFVSDPPNVDDSFGYGAGVDGV